MATAKNTKAPEASKKIPLNTEVACTNLTNGKLIYVSNKQLGYQVIWEQPNDVEYIELGELVSMRNSQRTFFEKAWIGIDDPEIIRFLKVEKYYKNIVELDEVGTFFDLPDDEIARRLETMSDGFRENLRNKAADMIKKDEIDSIKKVKFLKQIFNLDSISE